MLRNVCLHCDVGSTVGVFGIFILNMIELADSLDGKKCEIEYFTCELFNVAALLGLGVLRIRNYMGYRLYVNRHNLYLLGNR
eukprot:UN00675